MTQQTHFDWPYWEPNKILSSLSFRGLFGRIAEVLLREISLNEKGDLSTELVLSEVECSRDDILYL